MATLNETIEQVQNVFNDIEGALQEQGVDTENLKPVDYANAVRGIVNNISVENVNFIPTLIFKYVADNGDKTERPSTPIGGKWNISEVTGNSTFTAPEGWFANIDDYRSVIVSKDILYMSYSIFKNNGTDQYLKWTTPIKISGTNGIDGKQGAQGEPGNIAGIVQTFYTPIYYGAVKESDIPSTPTCNYDVANGVLSILTSGWTKEITTGEDGVIWYQSIATYKSNSSIVGCSVPVRISAAPTDLVEGVNNYYLLTDSLTPPSKDDPDWKLEPPAGFPVPTIDNRYLWTKVVTNYTHSYETGPIILVARYQKGLNSIDFDYYCAPSEDELKNLSEDQWFETSQEALVRTETYPGLDETTKYLWCRERFIFDDGVEDHYRIISTYTAAEKAAIIYPGGIFDKRTLYTRTPEQTLYVYYQEGIKLGSDGKINDEGKEYNYFVLKYSYDDVNHKISLNNGEYPSLEEVYALGNWEKMESFGAIYSDIGVFKAANVGQFVFDDKYIFSQEGKEGNYTDFVDYAVDVETSEVKRKGVALAIEKGAFTPNILLNAITGEAKFGGGTSVLRADGSGYLADGKISWDDNGLNVEGHVTAETFTTESNKLSKSISDLESDVETQIKEASDTWANSLFAYQTATGETINKLNLRLDGAVSNYYKEGVPTISIDELKKLFEETDDPNWDAHIGDTWTNINTYDESSEDENIKTGGLSWRWCDGDGDGHSDYVVDIGNKYHWHLISDTDATRALAKAGEALEAANSKTTTFISSKPENPRNGDLWIVPSDYNGDYRRNKTYVYNNEEWQPWTDPDISDLDDIKNAFKSGVSGIEGGLVFGEALAVFDQKNTEDTNDDTLMAVFSGSGEFVDDKGHKIIIAGGIPSDSEKPSENIKNAKFIVCDNGHIKIGDRINYNPDDGLISIGNYIKINDVDGSIEIYDRSSTENCSRKIIIGSDNPLYPMFYGNYEKYENGNRISQGIEMRLDGMAGCYGGGVLEASFYDESDLNNAKLYSCIEGYDTNNNKTPAMTVSSTGVSLLNLAGQIWGHRVSTLVAPTDKIVGTTTYDTENGSINCSNGDVNFSKSATSFVPQNIFFTHGQTARFVLPTASHSEAGDYFDLFKTTKTGTISIIVPKDWYLGTPKMFVKNNSDVFVEKTVHDWSSPGHYKIVYTGSEWYLIWLG